MTFFDTNGINEKAEAPITAEGQGAGARQLCRNYIYFLIL